MSNGDDTRGQVARSMAGTEGVEIKATIHQTQIEAVLSSYGLSKDDNERYIYFYDTPDLELFENGIVARARRIIGGQHDSTIKFRPVDPDAVPSLWRKYSGFKIEADWSKKGIVKSASLTMPVAKGLIKRVAAGKNPISDLFAEEQLLFLLSLASKKLDYAKVIVMGPIQVWRWKVDHPGLPWPITGELWSARTAPRFSRSRSRPRWSRVPRPRPASWPSWPKSAPRKTTRSKPRPDGRWSTTPPTARNSAPSRPEPWRCSNSAVVVGSAQLAAKAVEQDASDAVPDRSPTATCCPACP